MYETNKYTMLNNTKQSQHFVNSAFFENEKLTQKEKKND